MISITLVTLQRQSLRAKISTFSFRSSSLRLRRRESGGFSLQHQTWRTQIETLTVLSGGLTSLL